MFGKKEDTGVVKTQELVVETTSAHAQWMVAVEAQLQNQREAHAQLRARCERYEMVAQHALDSAREAIEKRADRWHEVFMGAFRAQLQPHPQSLGYHLPTGSDIALAVANARTAADKAYPPPDKLAPRPTPKSEMGAEPCAG